MNSKPKPALSVTVVTGMRVALVLLKGFRAVLSLIPAPDRFVFLSRQSNRPTADIAALTAELERTHPRRRVVVLARTMRSHRDLGYAFHLIRQVWHIAHARTVILDSYSLLTSNDVVRPDARVIQMWHAIGSFKKFGWDDIDASNPRRVQLAKALRMHAGNTAVLASSPASTAHFASAFNVDESRVLVSPLPRVDSLRDNTVRESTRKRVMEAHPELSTGKVLLVAPTIHSAMAEDSTIDRIRRVAATHGYTVVASFHPVTHGPQWGFTTNELLCAADAFLTDKSSLIYEAGILGLPGFLWAPANAQEELFAESYPTEEELRELIVENPDELFESLANPHRRSAAGRFAQRYVSLDQGNTATAHMAAIIANS